MIVGVSTWRGVGASTTALAMAATFAAHGERPWLVEADPAGGTLAVRLLLPLAATGGLERIAFPTARRGGPELFGETAHDHGGIRVVAAPGDAFRAWSCHSPRFPWSAALRTLDGPVVVDLGRLRGGQPNGALLGQLDALVLVTSPDSVDVVATTEWIACLGRVSPGDRGMVADVATVVVVDAPTVHLPASRSAIEDDLGDRLLSWIPWSTAAVDLLHRGGSMNDRRLRRQPIAHAVELLVSGLRSRTDIERAAS